MNRGPGGRELPEKLKERAAKRAAEDGESEEMNVAGPSGQSGVDALDYYGTWKLFDALTDAAFYGRNRRDALGNTPGQRFMGNLHTGLLQSLRRCCTVAAQSPPPNSESA